MPTITQFSAQSPVTLGQPANATLASAATAGGNLRAELSLSPSNDVYFGAAPAKVLPVAPNGTSPFTLVRGPGQRSPKSVKIFVDVFETGTNLPADDDDLVNLLP